MALRRVLAITLRCVVAIALLAFAPVVVAGPILFNVWYQFGFGTAGTPAAGCDPADPAGGFCIPSSGTPTEFLSAPPWTFVAPAGGATLAVTDAFLSGDRFQLFDFGVSLGLTSLPSANANCDDDPVVCIATAGMSIGSFVLAAGAHSITLIPILAPSDGGSGYLLVSAEGSAAPEPGALALTGLGLVVLFVWRRRRRR